MARKMLTGLDLTLQKIVNLADGSNPNDAVTKQQLDAIARGLDWKQSVRVATTAAITQSGLQTIDGQALAAGDLVLDKDNATGSLRGVWVAASGAWTRATWFDDSTEVTAAAAIPVESGTVNGDAVFILTNDGAITVGTTALAFTRLGGAGISYTAGNGLALSGASFSVVPKAGGGIVVDGTGVSLDTTSALLAKKYAADVPTSATATMTHNLGTVDRLGEPLLVVKATGEIVEADVVLGVNADTITFSTAPTTGQYRYSTAA